MPGCVSCSGTHSELSARLFLPLRRRSAVGDPTSRLRCSLLSYDDKLGADYRVSLNCEHSPGGLRADETLKAAWASFTRALLFVYRISFALKREQNGKQDRLSLRKDLLPFRDGGTL